MRWQTSIDLDELVRMIILWRRRFWPVDALEYPILQLKKLGWLVAAEADEPAVVCRHASAVVENFEHRRGWLQVAPS